MKDELSQGIIPILGNNTKTIETEADALAMVRQNGRALWAIPAALKTEALCLAAVEQNGWALVDVPHELRTVEVCAAAVRQTKWAMDYVPYRLHDAVSAALKEAV